jgi:hypothetical protein
MSSYNGQNYEKEKYSVYAYCWLHEYYTGNCPLCQWKTFYITKFQEVILLRSSDDCLSLYWQIIRIYFKISGDDVHEHRTLQILSQYTGRWTSRVDKP